MDGCCSDLPGACSACARLPPQPLCGHAGPRRRQAVLARARCALTGTEEHCLRVQARDRPHAHHSGCVLPLLPCRSLSPFLLLCLPCVLSSHSLLPKRNPDHISPTLLRPSRRYAPRKPPKANHSTRTWVSQRPESQPLSHSLRMDLHSVFVQEQQIRLPGPGLATFRRPLASLAHTRTSTDLRSSPNILDTSLLIHSVTNLPLRS